MTKTLALLIALLTASITQTGRTADETHGYHGLVEVQTVDQVSSRKADEESPYRLEIGDRRSSGDSESSYRLFGWLPEIRTKVESTGGKTLTPKKTAGATESSLRVAPYIGPELKPNELPYIDKDGNKDRNYGILLTAKWCNWCYRMYQDTVQPLRDEGFKIYIIDVDEFPDIKERIHRLDPSAEEMGKGVPYFIVRDGGKTKKIFYGYTEAEKIRPHLKNYQEQIDKETDYNFR